MGPEGMQLQVAPVALALASNKEHSNQSQNEEEQHDGSSSPSRSPGRDRARSKRKAPKRRRRSGSVSETDSDYEQMVSIANAAQASKEKNRQAQRRFRARQKEVITTLRQQVAVLEAELGKVQYESENLKAANAGLEEKLREAEIAKIKAEARAEVKGQMQAEIAAATRAALASGNYPGQGMQGTQMVPPNVVGAVRQEGPAAASPKAGMREDSPNQVNGRQQDSPQPVSGVMAIQAHRLSLATTSDGQTASPGPASELMGIPRAGHTIPSGVMPLPSVAQHSGLMVVPSAPQPGSVQQRAPQVDTLASGVCRPVDMDLVAALTRHQQQQQQMAPPHAGRFMEGGQGNPGSMLTGRQSNNTLGMVQLQAMGSAMQHMPMGMGLDASRLQGMNSNGLQGMSSMGLGGLVSMCRTDLSNMGGGSMSLSSYNPGAMQPLHQPNAQGVFAIDSNGQYISMLSDSMVQQALQQQQLHGMGLRSFSHGNNVICGQTGLLQLDMDAMRQTGQGSVSTLSSMPSRHCVQLNMPCMPGNQGFESGAMSGLKSEQCLPTSVELGGPRAMA